MGFRIFGVLKVTVQTLSSLMDNDSQGQGWHFSSDQFSKQLYQLRIVMEILNRENLRYVTYAAGTMASVGGWNCILGRSGNRVQFVEGVIISAMSICFGRMISKVVVYSVPRVENWVIALPSKGRPAVMIIFDSFAGVFPAWGLTQIFAWRAVQLPNLWGSAQQLNILPKPFNLGQAVVGCMLASFFTPFIMHTIAEICCSLCPERNSNRQIVDRASLLDADQSFPQEII